MEHTVNIRGLSRRFGSKLALDNVDFKAEQGRVYGLVGANGAGKTTLIRHILGLLRAKSGSVEVFGMDPVRHPKEVLSRIGYLSENRDLPDWMRVDEFMRYTSAFYAGWDQPYCDELLDTFRLERTGRIRELSRGMRAQVALISAVAHRPPLLLLDEPSSGLDAIVRKDILNAIVRTVSDAGHTVIFSSHLLEEVERLSDHVNMINDGVMVLEGDLEELTNAHLICQLSFPEPLASPPGLDDALCVQGAGRSWRILYRGGKAEIEAGVRALGGQLLDVRRATLEEIFIARAGRSQDSNRDLAA